MTTRLLLLPHQLPYVARKLRGVEVMAELEADLVAAGDDPDGRGVAVRAQVHNGWLIGAVNDVL